MACKQFISISELRDLATRAVLNRGYTLEQAEIISGIYLDAELCGKSSHGFRLLKSVHQQSVLNEESNREAITTEYETDTSALLKGNGMHGCYVAYKAMTMAIQKARTKGVGIVGVVESGHIGMLRYYSEMAVNQTLIGGVCATTPTAVIPYGSTQPLLGTNPISVGIPSKEPFIFDMSTAAITYNAITQYAARGRALPDGVVLDSNNNALNDATEALSDELRILPFGAHKGAALAIAVEILAGCWTNSCIGLAKQKKSIDTSLFSALFFAFKVDLLLPEDVFMQKVEILLDDIRKSSPTENFDYVLVPGDKSKQTKERTINSGKLMIENKLLEYLRQQAAQVPSRKSKQTV